MIHYEFCRLSLIVRGCRKLFPHRKPQTSGDIGRKQSEDRQEKVIGRLRQKGAPFQQNTFHLGTPCSRAGGMCLVRMCPIWLYRPYLPASQVLGRAARVADILLEGPGCLPALLGGSPSPMWHPCAPPRRHSCGSPALPDPLPGGTYAHEDVFPAQVGKSLPAKGDLRIWTINPIFGSRKSTS